MTVYKAFHPANAIGVTHLGIRKMSLIISHLELVNWNLMFEIWDLLFEISVLVIPLYANKKARHPNGTGLQIKAIYLKLLEEITQTELHLPT